MFSPKLDTAMYETKQLILFNDLNKPIVNLKIVAGLSNDHSVPREKIKVLLNKFFDVYVAENSYMTSDPLPLPWMELFGAKMTRKKSFGPYLEEEEFYTPTITLAEMRKMQDMSVPQTTKAANRILLDKVESTIPERPVTVRIGNRKKKRVVQPCPS